MNIVSVMVTMSIMGAAAPQIATMSIQPLIAQKRSANFAVAETLANTYADAANVAYELPEVPEICKVNEDKTEVSCTEGTGPYLMIAKRSFRLVDPGAAGNLGVYWDNDRDGFDDVTGLPTHYWECYSGWKGGSNALKNNCNLGGKYVIPAYVSIYQ